MCGAANLEDIKLGQIFGSSKNGSWALVDARNFFFLIYEFRACTGNFGDVPKYTFGLWPTLRK